MRPSLNYTRACGEQIEGRTGLHGGAFTLVELLVVMSIIAILIAILLPALEKMRATTRITLCGSNAHHISIGIFSFAADRDGALPPHSSYDPHAATHGIRNTGDWFDVLVLGYAPDPEGWYCPDGIFFHDTPAPPVPPGIGSQGIWWDFFGWGGPGHLFVTYAMYANLEPYGSPLYTDVPTTVEDPPDWIIVNDMTMFETDTQSWGQGSHPAVASNWGLTPGGIGRNDPGGATGANSGMLDGSVVWTPQAQCDLGYPGGGSSVRHIIERPKNQ